jgi:hypothetical protein
MSVSSVLRFIVEILFKVVTGITALPVIIADAGEMCNKMFTLKNGSNLVDNPSI